MIQVKTNVFLCHFIFFCFFVVRNNLSALKKKRAVSVQCQEDFLPN